MNPVGQLCAVTCLRPADVSVSCLLGWIPAPFPRLTFLANEITFARYLQLILAHATCYACPHLPHTLPYFDTCDAPTYPTQARNYPFTPQTALYALTLTPCLCSPYWGVSGASMRSRPRKKESLRKLRRSR